MNLSPAGSFGSGYCLTHHRDGFPETLKTSLFGNDVINPHTFLDSHLCGLRKEKKICQQGIEFIVPGDCTRHRDKHHYGNQRETTRIAELSNLSPQRTARVYVHIQTKNEITIGRKQNRKQVSRQRCTQQAVSSFTWTKQ